MIEMIEDSSQERLFLMIAVSLSIIIMLRVHLIKFLKIYSFFAPTQLKH